MFRFLYRTILFSQVFNIFLKIIYVENKKRISLFLSLFLAVFVLSFTPRASADLQSDLQIIDEDYPKHLALMDQADLALEVSKNGALSTWQCGREVVVSVYEQLSNGVEINNLHIENKNESCIKSLRKLSLSIKETSYRINQIILEKGWLAPDNKTPPEGIESEIF